MLLYVCTQAQMFMSATANRYQCNLFDHLTSWCSGARFNGRWMEPCCRHGANKKDVWSKSDNSVILFWLLRQQVDIDQQPCSFCPPVLSDNLSSLFHPYFFSIPLLSFPPYPSQSPLPVRALSFFFFPPLPLLGFCHPPFLIRLFVPSFSLPGVYNACLSL